MPVAAVAIVTNRFAYALVDELQKWKAADHRMITNVKENRCRHNLSSYLGRTSGNAFEAS